MIGRGIVRANLGTGGIALAHAAVASVSTQAPADLIAEVHALYVGSYQAGLVTHPRLYPGAADTLSSLSANGIAVALCTNKMTSLTMPLLRALGIDNAFDVIVCVDTLGRKEPEPDQIRYILNHLKTAPASAVMVGDTAIDQQAAAAAFVAFVHARYGYGDDLPLSPPWIESLTELTSIAFGPLPLPLRA